MPHKQDNLERQLTIAQTELDARNAQLDERGVAEGDRKKDPAWRRLNATRTSLKSRMRAAAAIVDLDEEVKRRKAEKPPKGEAEESKGKGKKGEKQPAQEGKKKKKS